jgi:hypothetical protein
MSSSNPPAGFPDFLAATYRPDELHNVDSTLAALDTSGTILWVNEAWHRFARDNGGEPALGRYRSYLDGISGPLRDAYRQMLETAVATGKVFEHDYECSSASTIRSFRMRVLPFSLHGLLVEHTPIASRPAPSGELPVEALYLDRDNQIVQCSNCRRVRRPDEVTECWVWIPEWVTHSHPRTSHGLCTACTGYYWRRRKHRP